MAGINVGDIVNVIDGGKKIVAQVVELGEDAWGEAVAFVHRLEHDGIPLPLRQTADTSTVDAKGAARKPDSPVPFVEPIGKSAPDGSNGTTAGTTTKTASVAGSTLDTLGAR